MQVFKYLTDKSSELIFEISSKIENGFSEIED